MNKTKRYVSLKTSLSLIVSLLIAVLVAVISLLAYNSARGQLEAPYVQQMNSTNDTLAQSAEAFYIQQERAASFLAKNPAVIEAARSRSVSAVEPLLREFFDELKIYENLFISTPDKDTEIIVDGIGGKSLGQHWANDAFAANIDGALQGKVWSSSAVKSPTTGRAVVLVTAPIVDGDKVIGILGLPFDLQTFGVDLVKNMKIGRTGFPVLMDSSGMTIAHPDPSFIFKVNMAEYDWGRKVLASPADTLIRYTFLGKDKLIMAAKNEKYRLVAASTANPNIRISGVMLRISLS